MVQTHAITDMRSFRFRPSFAHDLEMPPDLSLQAISEKVRKKPAQIGVKCFRGFMCKRIPIPERHFWKGSLMLGLESTEGEGKHIIGTCGLNANVWTTYLCGYLFT